MCVCARVWDAMAQSSSSPAPSPKRARTEESSAATCASSVADTADFSAATCASSVADISDFPRDVSPVSMYDFDDNATIKFREALTGNSIAVDASEPIRTLHEAEYRVRKALNLSSEKKIALMHDGKIVQNGHMIVGGSVDIEVVVVIGCE